MSWGVCDVCAAAGLGNASRLTLLICAIPVCKSAGNAQAKRTASRAQVVYRRGDSHGDVTGTCAGMGRILACVDEEAQCAQHL